MTQLIGINFYGKRADGEKAFLEVLISVETSSGDTVEKENNGRGLLGDNISILLVGRIVSDGFDSINNKVSESFGRYPVGTRGHIHIESAWKSGENSGTRDCTSYRRVFDVNFSMS